MILPGLSKCPICGAVLEKGQRLIGTPHFIRDQNDPLWRFSDAGMHYECFQHWPHRVEKYNATLGQFVWGDGTCHRMRPDGEFESVQPIPSLPKPEFKVGDWVEVRLSDSNRTPHAGEVGEVVWHFEEARYYYHLIENDKRVKKRYFAEDLQRIDR